MTKINRGTIGHHSILGDDAASALMVALAISLSNKRKSRVRISEAPVKTERDEWNEAVEKRKAEKKAKKQARRQS